MIIKIIGLGLKEYLRDTFNLFDAIIVVFSIGEFIYSMFYVDSNGGSGALTAFRAFRLLRIFKLTKRWKKLQDLIETIGKSLKDISSFSILLAIFIYIYTLIGLELMAFEIKFDENNDPIHGKS